MESMPGTPMPGHPREVRSPAQGELDIARLLLLIWPVPHDQTAAWDRSKGL